MRPPTYPSFGMMGYWHLVKHAPLGEDEVGRAERLLSIWEDCSEKVAGEWPISPIVLRAMALELSVACGLQGRPLPDALIRLLADLLSLPADFLTDPTPLFAGDDGRGGPDRRAKNRAMWLDALHAREYGDQMSGNKLAERVAKSRSTIRAWREEGPYRDFVEFFKRQHSPPEQ